MYTLALGEEFAGRTLAGLQCQPEVSVSTGTTVALTDSKEAEKGVGRGLSSLSLVNGLPG